MENQSPTPAPEAVLEKPEVQPEEVRKKGPATSKQFITHDAIIDFVLANPRSTNDEIAKAFGYSVGGIRVILTSDSFRSRYEKRRTDLVDPIVTATLENRLNALAQKSAEIVAEQLELSAHDKKFALEVMIQSTKSLADRIPKAVPQTNLGFVVHLPGPASSSAEWASRFAPTSGQMLPPRLEEAVSEVVPSNANTELLELPERVEPSVDSTPRYIAHPDAAGPAK
jgi:hypothetical protein